MCRFAYCILVSFYLSAAPLARAAPPPVDVFVEEARFGHMDLSPDGKYLAVVQFVKKQEHVRVVSILEISDAGLKAHRSIKVENVRIFGVNWANNTRLLLSVQAYDPKTGSPLTISRTRLVWRPPQLLAMNADLTDQIALLKDEWEFKFTADKSETLHWLPRDPNHILMELYDSRGRASLNVYKVNVYSGKPELVERGNRDTVSWMADAAGNIRMRTDRNRGTTTIHARNTPGDEWFEIAKYRRRETPDIFPFGFSPDPNIVYVASYYQDDRLAAYEFDMKARARGKLLFVHPKVDVMDGVFTDGGRRLVGVRYVVDKPQTHYIVPEFGKFERMLERAFGAENYARPIASAQNENLMIIKVTGPRDPGTYYLYNARTRRAEEIGLEMTSLSPAAMGRMQPMLYKARDGVEISAYLTLPPGKASKPPLVVMPHGGPEARDYLEWDPWAQFLATRGYAVLQPNFRGSDGYGKKFIEAGHKQWGLRMQDDITDGVRHVIGQGLVDGGRVCIFGASYGGYAALAGAAFTPELYKCAISVNGVSDLYVMLRWERNRGEEYHYWKRSIGDPGDRADRARIQDRSPIRAAASLRVPVLLMAGDKDETVPVDQSRKMAKALKTAGKPHQYVEFKGEGHSFKEFDNRRKMLLEVEKFLARHIGPEREAGPAAKTDLAPRGQH